MTKQFMSYSIITFADFLTVFVRTRPIVEAVLCRNRTSGRRLLRVEFVGAPCFVRSMRSGLREPKFCHQSKNQPKGSIGISLTEAPTHATVSPPLLLLRRPHVRCLALTGFVQTQSPWLASSSQPHSPRSETQARSKSRLPPSSS